MCQNDSSFDKGSVALTAVVLLLDPPLVRWDPLLLASAVSEDEPKRWAVFDAGGFFAVQAERRTGVVRRRQNSANAANFSVIIRARFYQAAATGAARTYVE